MAIETLGSLVEPSLLSDNYCWALMSVSVSTDLWYLRSLPPFHFQFDRVHARTNVETQTAANIKFPGYLEYTKVGVSWGKWYT